MSVVVVGDANVDLEIRLPTVGRPDPHSNPEPRLFGGGSAANTAAGLAALGIDCRFVGTVGDDPHGRFATASLADAGVDVEAVTAVADQPTVMVVVVVPPAGDRLIYVWPPTGGAHAALTADQATAAIVASDWLHVSGLCLRVTPARDAVLAAMQAANESGIPVSFDLNLRLENWGWDGGFREVVEMAISRSNVVFGSAHDEITPLSGLSDPIDAAQQLAGPDRVVIARLGPDGAVACSAQEPVEVPGFDVAVVDTVGAGDAFNAGFIAAQIGGNDVAEGLRWGSAVAALAISQPGARATPTLSELQAMLLR